MITREMAPVARSLFQNYPVLMITGPRQSGKTTLCRSEFPDLPCRNLENLNTRSFAQSDPVGFIDSIKDGAVIDEFQRVPTLLSQIQVEVDRQSGSGRFVITGSSQLSMMSSVSQSLAGRTGILRLLPFSVQEAMAAGTVFEVDDMIFTGGYPRLHDGHLDPCEALGSYIETYVEKDVRDFAQIRDLRLFHRFLQLCAGRVGQLWNETSLANDVGVSRTTIAHWVSILEASYIVFLLPPHHENIRKRLVKSSKLYFYDVGLATCLLGLSSAEQVAAHPLRGNLFENLVVTEMMKYCLNRGRRPDFRFYRDATGNEVDVLFQVGNQWVPVEIKSGKTINADCFRGFAEFAGVMGDKAGKAIVVYGGDEEQMRVETIVTTVPQLSYRLAQAGL